MITREADYALRIMRSLSDEQRHTVGEMTQKELIPQAFAYKIVKKLQKAGYLRVIRGVEGGCLLTVDLKQVSLLELITVIEDGISINACMEAGYTCQWNACHGGCAVHQKLMTIQSRIEDELGSHSLYELFERTIKQ